MSLPDFPLPQALKLTPRIRHGLEAAMAVINGPRHLDGDTLSVIFTDLKNFINFNLHRRGTEQEQHTSISRDSLRIMIERNLFQVNSICEAAGRYPPEQHRLLNAPGAYRIIAGLAIDLEYALACDPLRENAAAPWRGANEEPHSC